ncbi:hypothetical protein RBB80_08760 [Tunturiibacter gelidiferens]
MAPARPQRDSTIEQPTHRPLRRTSPHTKRSPQAPPTRLPRATRPRRPLRTPAEKITAHDLSRYQAVERDFSFVFPDATQWQAVSSAIHALAIPELQSLKPIEVFRDAKKYPGVYSLLLRTVFQSNDRTLREEELTDWWTRIIATLTALGGTIRDGAATAS